MYISTYYRESNKISYSFILGGVENEIELQINKCDCCKYYFLSYESIKILDNEFNEYYLSISYNCIQCFLNKNIENIVYYFNSHFPSSFANHPDLVNRQDIGEYYESIKDNNFIYKLIEPKKDNDYKFKFFD